MRFRSENSVFKFLRRVWTGSKRDKGRVDERHERHDAGGRSRAMMQGVISLR